MNTHTLEVLEFSRIAEIIAGYCLCEEARTICLQKRPSSDSTAIALAKKLGRDYLHLLHLDDIPPLKTRPPLESVGVHTDVTHGITLSAVSLPYYQHIMPYDLHKFTRFAINV